MPLPPTLTLDLQFPLREYQTEAVKALVNTCPARDVLLLVPTGYGKSIVYWTAGQRLGGLTLVVSPLRALIRNQIARLTAMSVPAWAWNSDTTGSDKQTLSRRLTEGSLVGFLYTTPESLSNRRFRDLLQGVRLIAIDEARCALSETSYRPDYRKLGQHLSDLGATGPTIACTATLRRSDRDSLVESLRLDSPAVITVPVERSNLTFDVQNPRCSVMIAQCYKAHAPESGIVFAATRRTVQTLCEELTALNYPATCYHGGMNRAAREEAFNQWFSGRTPIMVATDAFGLGIHNPSCRWVFTYDPPKDIEDWVQQFGRAGRDGAGAVIYAAFGESSGKGHGIDFDEGVRSRAFLLASSWPTLADIAAVWHSLSEVKERDEYLEGPWSRLVSKVLGPSAVFSSVAIKTALTRKGLLESQYGAETATQHPDSSSSSKIVRKKRRSYFRCCGDFGSTDWSDYHADRQTALTRWNNMRTMMNRPSAEIASALDTYFDPDREPS